MINTYLQYGVPSCIANDLSEKGVPVTTFRTTSANNLESKYGIDPRIIQIVKPLITRQPIDEAVVTTLLERSNFTCCCCKGVKSNSYIIHHIEEYSESQDNSYSNLVVLCPACHDLAHRGPGLTNVLTTEQILRNKENWDKQVEKQNAEAAARSGKINDADYLNIPRIAELSNSLIDQLPQTSLSDVLLIKDILSSYGQHIDEKGLGVGLSDGGHSIRVQHHFLRVFQSLLHRLNFVNLDDLLNKGSLSRPDFIGTFCFYIGGLIGKGITWPYTPGNLMSRLYLRRKGFYCEWLIDPKYITSSTSSDRLSGRSVFLVYGRIKSVGKKTLNNKKHIAIDIRPYAIGTPTATINRTPNIAYIKAAEYMLDYDGEEDSNETSAASIIVSP
ncbi:MAG: HNH endonuclease [Nitrospirae bacterium]|nr:HNH endonuclease [Nitrospirota bacterium]